MYIITKGSVFETSKYSRIDKVANCIYLNAPDTPDKSIISETGDFLSFKDHILFFTEEHLERAFDAITRGILTGASAVEILETETDLSVIRHGNIPKNNTNINNILNPMHRAVKDQLSGMVGDAFLANLYTESEMWKAHYTSPSYRITSRHAEEFPVVKLLGKKPNGEPNYSICSMDYVFMVQPRGGSIIHGGCFSVGLEIKSSERDLSRADRQLNSYYGHCDYYFIAVPERLVDLAIDMFDNEERVGVMGYETGEIYKMPKRSKVTPENRIMMYERLSFCDNQDPVHYIDIVDKAASLTK